MEKFSESYKWRPAASQHLLELRAEMYSRIRDYFKSQNVIEVETPIINLYAVTDPNLDCLKSKVAGEDVYLHTSPEYAMKRLLAHYEKDIYQICKVFRAEESGRYHHQEFTMLEWYRTNRSYLDLMKEVDELVRIAIDGLMTLASTINLSFDYIFKEFCDLEINNAQLIDYKDVCEREGVMLNSVLSIKEYQELIVDQVIATKFPKNCLTFIYNFPNEHASLARLNQDGFAERFELYIGAVELANGFQELTDAPEQIERFNHDNQIRQQSLKQIIDIDENFISALQNGLPECAGVALGLDRLLMIMTGAIDIKEILAFPNS